MNITLKGLKAKAHSILNYIRHFGWKYTCPICGYHQSSLKVFSIKEHDLFNLHIIGAGRRPCICWNCGCNDRERLIYLYCKNILGLFSKKGKKYSLLHMAPERQLSKKFLQQKNIEYTMGDICPENYPGNVQKMDITNLPISNNCFDFIICNHVLEHVVSDKKAMQEIYRVLKPGGIAILQVPICPENTETEEDLSATEEERSRRFGQCDHVRLYGLDYKNRLEQCGFCVEIIEPNPNWEKYGINMEERLYIAKKL